MGWSWRAAGAGMALSLLAACGGSDTESVASAATCSGAGGSGWCWLQPSTPPRQWVDFQFLDARRGWASGESGAMVSTADGGRSWQWVETPLREEISLVRFADPEHGWAHAFGSSTVLATVDGGRHWEAVGVVPLGAAHRYRVRAVQNLWVRADGVLVAGSAEWGTAVSDDAGRNWRTLTMRPVTEVGRSGTLWGRVPAELTVSWDNGRSAGLSFDCRPSCYLAAVDLADDRQLAILTTQFEGYRLAALKRHTSNDAGRTWQSTELAFPDPGDGGRFQVMPAFPYPSASLDAGQGWGQIRRPVPMGPGEVDYRLASIWHTPDAGSSWRQAVAPPVPPGPGAEIRALDGRSLWLTTEGRSFLTLDAGRSWREPRIADESGTPYAMRITSGIVLAGYGKPGRGTRWYNSPDGGATWTTLPGGQADRDGEIHALWFADALNGRAVQGNFVLTTLDGGRTWTRQSPAQLMEGNPVIYFGPDGTLWLTRESGLQRSRDAGRTWEPAALPPAASVRAQWVQFVDGLNGWVSAWKCTDYRCPVTLYRTRDGGTTWQALGPDEGVTGFADATTGVRQRADKRLERTTDGGATWTSLDVDPSSLPQAFRIHFHDARHGWLLGEGAVSRTTDGGQSWTPWRPLPQGARATAIHFADPDHGWITTDRGMVVATRDGGVTWERQESHTERRLSSLFALNADTVWIGGVDALLATRTGGRAR